MDESVSKERRGTRRPAEPAAPREWWPPALVLVGTSTGLVANPPPPPGVGPAAEERYALALTFHTFVTPLAQNAWNELPGGRQPAGFYAVVHARLAAPRDVNHLTALLGSLGPWIEGQFRLALAAPPGRPPLTAERPDCALEVIVLPFGPVPAAANPLARPDETVHPVPQPAGGAPAEAADQHTGDERDGVDEDGSKPQESDREAFERVVAELAARDDARRQSLAALIRPLLTAHLRHTPAPTYAAKAELTAAINDALARFELELVCEGRPHRLTATRSGEGDGTGRFRLEPRNEEGPPVEASEGTGLPALELRPQPALGPWRAREEARRLAARPAESESGPRANPFLPLVPAARASREELARQLLEPLKDRVRAMPYGTQEEKHAVAQWVNGQLREFGLRLRVPGGGQPGLLMADRAGDRNSRFVIYYLGEDGKRRRPFSTTDLDALLAALELMPAPPRRTRPR